MQEVTQKKWTLEVQEDPVTGDCYIQLPPEVLEQVGWQEGDTLNWIDNGDSSWSITKKD